MKPSSTNDHYIPQTITLGCIVLFSLTVRSTTLSCGADGFTAFCVFLICSVVFFLLFLAVQSLLEEFSEHIFRPQERGGGANIRTQQFQHHCPPTINNFVKRLFK